MDEIALGRFGDRRLEKGGSFCTRGWWRMAAAAFGFVGLAGIVRARSGSRGFCAIRQ